MKRLTLMPILLCSSLYANNADSKGLEDLSLEELMNIKIYSATKSYQRLEEIPANIVVITRKDIEKYNYSTLDELLRHVPGLFILDDTEHFQIGSRGSLGSSFQLMINNNPISPLRVPRGGTSNRNFFATPVEAIDRIEIIKGPQAVTYGSNSMYGSINIITNDFNEKNIVSLGTGNNGQRKAFVRLNHKYDEGGITANASFYNTDGISGDLKKSFSQSDYQDLINSNAHTSLEGLLGNRYKTLDISHRYKNLTTDINVSETNYNMYFNPSFRDGTEVEQTDKSIALTYEDELNPNLSYKANFIASQKDYRIDDIATLNYIQYGNKNRAEGERYQFDAHLNYMLTKNLKVLLGTTYKNISEKTTLTSENFKAEQKYNYDFSEVDLYSKLSYKVNDKFEVNAGIRYSQKEDFTLKREGKLLATNQPLNLASVDVKKKKDYLPEFSAIYHLDSNNHIKLLYGKANQLRYQDIDTYEEIDSAELNYIYFSKNYQINTALFYNKAENISLFTQSTINVPSYYTGTQETKGAEFSVKYKHNYNFETLGSVTIQETKNDIENASENFKPDFSPNMLAKLNMTYLHEKTRYSLMLDYISSMKASVNSTTNQRYGKDSDDIINLSANINHKFNKNLSVNLNATNILDRDNRIPAGSTLTNFENGFFTKGREFLFNLKYKF